jgi:uncharacterized protein
MLIIGYIFAIAVGISLGLIGGGGSILAVPILKYVMGIGDGKEIAMSLAIVGFVSLIGAIPHWFNGNVNFKTAIIFTPPAMVGAFLGAKLGGFDFVKENNLQIICFGIVMVIASYFMITSKTGQKKKKSLSNHKHHQQNQEDNFELLGEDELENYIEDHSENLEHHHILPLWILIPIEGLLVGILTGFVGVGGGFLIIPALVLLGGIAMKEAVGTSLLIIAFKSAAGFSEYVQQLNFTKADWMVMVYFTISATIGILLGAFLTKFIDGKYLEKAFGYFVLIVAAYILVRR